MHFHSTLLLLPPWLTEALMLHDRKMLQSLSVHPGACSDQDNDNEGEQKETTRRQREIINKCFKKNSKIFVI